MIFHTTVPATPERLNNMHYHLIVFTMLRSVGNFCLCPIADFRD